METLNRALDYFFSFPAYVMLPLVILVIALTSRMKPGEALLSSLKLAAGFAGVFIVFDFFVSSIGPAVEQIIEFRGLDFPVLDVGWPPLAAITWASPIAPLTIPMFLVLNVLMLATRTTKTINLDIWNYWHYALLGTLILNTTRSLWLGLLATLVIGVYSIKLADWNAVFVERRAGIKGIAITTVSINGMMPYAVVVDQIFEKIPGLRSISYNPEAVARREATAVSPGDQAEEPDRLRKILVLLSEPMIIGVIVGAFLGILAGYQLRELLELAVHIAAVMFLLPPCGSLIGKGIEPVSLRLKEVIVRRFPKRHDLRVGMDSGPLLQNRSILVTGLLLMPISLGLAFVIPGNRTLPLGDLPNLVSVIAIVVLVLRNNVLRAVLAGIPIVATFMIAATQFSGLYTRLARDVGFEIEGYTGPITAFTDGGHQIRFLFFHIFQGNAIALASIPIVLLLMWYTRKISKRLEASDKA
jgi:PTS system galactitol-specific IIC component